MLSRFPEFYVKLQEYVRFVHRIEMHSGMSELFGICFVGLGISKHLFFLAWFLLYI